MPAARWVSACALALLASCGGDAPGGLRPVGDRGFEVATDGDGMRLLVDDGAVYVAGHGEPTQVFAAARFERGGRGQGDLELGALSLGGDRASYVRGELGEEWYELRDQRALEQGWSLERSPGERADGRLEVVLDLGAEVELVRESDDSVEVRVRDGQVTYSGPVARDASGTLLAATLRTRDRAVVLSIDDSGAAYPIEIDPLIALSEFVLPLTTGRTVDYGFSVAIDGNTLFVGQPDVVRDTTNVLVEGVVHQYSRGAGSTWTYVRRIRVSGTSSTAAFGSSVAVHGDWLVVGAPYDTTYGRVYAIRISGGFNANGVPTTVQQIAPPVSVFTFGSAISLSGSRLAISGELANQVFVFNVSGNTWSNTTAHRITGTGGFGTSIALARNNANLLVVGAPSHSTNGRVLIHRWNGSSWGTATTIVPLTSPSQQTNFGVSVAVSGSANAEHVAIGCLSSSGTRAQLVRTIYSPSTWSTPSIQIDGSMNGYLSTTETLAFGTDDRCPHVAIAPDSSSAGNDILLLGLPNAVASSGGTGTVVGTHIALPSGISAVQRPLPGASGVIHSGRSVATDGVTVAVGDEFSSLGYVLTHQIWWANGTSCSSATQCNSGMCVDGVCCNSACGSGATNDCQACSTALGTSVNGTCGALTAGAAPTVTCRVSTGLCDSAETCVAGSTTCPTNALRPNGYPCGTAGTGGCDIDDTCTGSSASCPNAVQSNGVVCRAAAANTCDRTETCNGVSLSCPVDTQQPAGTPCGTDTSDPCDAPDVCNGSSFVCPELYASSATVCRGAVSGCDTAETCTGSSVTCPVEAPPVALGTVCRFVNPMLPCDGQDECDGVARTCPDGPADLGTLCRAAPGACDVPESCDGFSFACPADAFEDAYTLCRPASTTTPPGSSDCDVPEYCSGGLASCPTDLGAPFAECCGVNDWADGQQCRTDYLCVDAGCTPHIGCGDGWLEGAERCDDHNTVDGDACSTTCAPTSFVIAARPLAIDAPTSARSVAIDGEGNVLVAWAAEDTGVTRVRARRYTRRGNVVGAVLEIASIAEVGWDPQIAVAGAPDGGWGVAWRQPAGSEVGTVVVRRIDVGGTLHAALRAAPDSETLTEDPTIVGLGEGAYVVGWTNETSVSAPRIEARLIGATAGDMFDFGLGSDPVLAIGPDVATMVWVELPELGFRPRILGAHIDSIGLPFEIASSGNSPTIAIGDTGYFVGWVGYDGSVPDPQGDIFVRAVPFTGTPTAARQQVTSRASSAAPTHAERAPSIARSGSGWIIAWDEPTEGRVRLAAGGGATLPPESASILVPALTDVLAGDVSLASSPLGTWVVWSAAYNPIVPAPEPVPSAARATWGFILPPS